MSDKMDDILAYAARQGVFGVFILAEPDDEDALSSFHCLATVDEKFVPELLTHWAKLTGADEPTIHRDIPFARMS